MSKLTEEKDTNLKVKKEFRDENGNLDLNQLLDDIDQHLGGEDDISTLRAIRYEVIRRVEVIE